jgi:formate dehydrogenase subunit gamma
MNTKENTPTRQINIIHTYPRFSVSQRWEHTLLVLSVIVLVLTGVPQKYKTALWSQQILSTPERLAMVQTIHRVAATLFILEIGYHLANAVLQIARRKMSADIFPNFDDFRDAWQMFLYLLFITKEKPKFGKYNFEQKFTYWFLFFGLGSMAISGLILWFPERVTRVLSGGVIPAALLVHSNEAMVLVIFVVIWHFYHVHIERLNLSIFTGWLNEEDMRTYHSKEYERLMPQTGDQSPDVNQAGGDD